VLSVDLISSVSLSFAFTNPLPVIEHESLYEDETRPPNGDEATATEQDAIEFE